MMGTKYCQERNKCTPFDADAHKPSQRATSGILQIMWLVRVILLLCAALFTRTESNPGAI